MSRIIFAFSGQGSHYYQMGRDLFQTNALFKHWLEKADKLLREWTSRSLITFLYDKNRRIGEEFDDLEFSHPALFAIQFAGAMVVKEFIDPDFLIGVSLGEIVALAVAEVLSFEEIFKYLVIQAREISKHCEEGAMISVFAKKDQIEKAVRGKEVEYFYALEGGEENYTLSLPIRDYSLFQDALKEHNILFRKLPVKYPFHCQKLDFLKSRLIDFSLSLSLEPSKIPIFSMIENKVIRSVGPQHLWNIVRETVFMHETLERFLEKEKDQIIDLSPSGAILGSIPLIFGRDCHVFQKSKKFFHLSKNSSNNPKNALL